MSGAINIHYEWAKVPQTEKDTDTKSTSTSSGCGWLPRTLVLIMAQLPFESRRPGNQSRIRTHTRTHMRSGTSCREGHVAEKYVTPELNNKINDICPSSWAPFLNSIKFYENAAIKLYMRELAHMC